MVKYHDEEWGVPCHDDRKLFEYIVLDTFQAGLSWRIVLNKRENFRKALDNFDPAKISSYGPESIRELESNAGIIRNRLKIAATVSNAKVFLETKKEFGSFDKYIWQFTNYKTIPSHRRSIRELPARTKESDAMSVDLKKRGFTFVGSTICYAYMQAAGLVNDHLVGCFRRSLTS